MRAARAVCRGLMSPQPKNVVHRQTIQARLYFVKFSCVVWARVFTVCGPTPHVVAKACVDTFDTRYKFTYGEESSSLVLPAQHSVHWCTLNGLAATVLRILPAGSRSRAWWRSCGSQSTRMAPSRNRPLHAPVCDRLAPITKDVLQYSAIRQQSVTSERNCIEPV